MTRRELLLLAGGCLSWPVAGVTSQATAQASERSASMETLLNWVRDSGDSYVLTPDLAQHLGLLGDNCEGLRKITMSDDDRTHMVAVEHQGSRIFMAYQVSVSTLVFWATSESGAAERTLERDIE